MVIERVAWPETGGLARRARFDAGGGEWREEWVSGAIHGAGMVRARFPAAISQVLKILKAAGALVGVVFHDVEPFSGKRGDLNQLRRRAQVHAMRKAMRPFRRGRFTVPIEKISWIKRRTWQRMLYSRWSKFAMAREASSKKSIFDWRRLSVAVFALREGNRAERKSSLSWRLFDLPLRASGNLRLIVLGRQCAKRRRRS